MQIGKITELTISAIDENEEPIVLDISGAFKDAMLDISRNAEYANGIFLRNVNNKIELSVPEFSGTINISLNNKQRGLFRRFAHGSEM